MNNFKSFSFKSLIILLLLLGFVSLNKTNVYAAEPTSISLGGQVTGNLTDTIGEQDYLVTLPNAGRLSVTINSSIEYAYLDLLDSNGNAVWGQYVINSGVFSGNLDLESGTYHIRLYKTDVGYTGSYSLNTGYTPAENNETEPNNSTSQATQINLNTQTIKGFFSWNDNEDYYKLSLPKDGDISVNIDSSIESAYLDLLDSNGSAVWGQYVVNAEKFSNTVYLKAGTYYIRLYKSISGYTGTYLLSVKCPSLIPSAPTVYEVSNLSTIVKGKTEANAAVSVKIASKVYTTTSDKSGNFTVTIPKQVQGVKILVSVKNIYGFISADRPVTVLDRIAPAVPVVNKFNSKSRAITGKSEAYSTITAYIGTRQIGYAKADKLGNYTIKLSAQKAGIKIKIVAKDTSGNISNGSIITVQK